jgi:hypothetical protein
MKKIFFILFLVFLGENGYSQYIYYGYPSAKTILRKGEIVILNIPVFTLNGGNRFVKMEEIDSLVMFLTINDTNTLRIEINVFWGLDSLFCESLSNRLGDNLKEMIESKTTLKNYYIVSNGSKNPISCEKEYYWKYIYLNSRIEIIVE